MGAAQVSAGNRAGTADNHLLRKGLPSQAKGLEKDLRLFTPKVTGTVRDFKLVNESQGGILEASFRYPCGAETGHLRQALCHLSALCPPRFLAWLSSTVRAPAGLWGLHASCLLFPWHRQAQLPAAAPWAPGQPVLGLCDMGYGGLTHLI